MEGSDAAKTIVVGIDGSECSKAALLWAVAEARLRGSRLYAVQAYHMQAGATASPGGAAAVGWSVDDLKNTTEKSLSDLIEQTLGQAPDVDLHPAVAHGNAVDVLVRAAEKEDAELLVVGSRGRGGFKNLLLGSVSQQCATHAKCPVVVVHP